MIISHVWLWVLTYLFLYLFWPWSGWTVFLPVKYSISKYRCLCCSLEKILWDLIGGRVPIPTQKNALFAADFPQTHWQSDPRPPIYQVWIQSFPSPRLVASPKLKNPVCPTAVGRIIGFIHFPRVLVLCEMQLYWSRIWTRVAVSFSDDDNHYTTGTLIMSDEKLEEELFYAIWSQNDWVQG